MEEITPILIGGIIGLFIALFMLPARTPHITVLQIEREEPQSQSGGGLGLVLMMAIVGLVLLSALS